MLTRKKCICKINKKYDFNIKDHINIFNPELQKILKSKHIQYTTFLQYKNSKVHNLNLLGFLLIHLYLQYGLHNFTTGKLKLYIYFLKIFPYSMFLLNFQMFHVVNRICFPWLNSWSNKSFVENNKKEKMCRINFKIVDGQSAHNKYKFKFVMKTTDNFLKDGSRFKYKEKLYVQKSTRFCR